MLEIKKRFFASVMYLFLLALIIPLAESAVSGECDVNIKGWYQVGKGLDATCFYCKDDNGECLDVVFKDNVCVLNNIYDKYCSYSQEKLSGYDASRGVIVDYDFCGDQINNDPQQDTEVDFTDSDCQENLQTPTYSTPAIEGSTITATCLFTPLVSGQPFSGYTFQNSQNGGKPSVEAFLGGVNCGTPTWSGNNAIFTCNVGSQGDLECKSIQQGKIDSKTINVPIQLQTCAQKGGISCPAGQIPDQKAPSSDNPNCVLSCKADPNDNDADGYTSVASGGNDCNDNDPNINPGKSESGLTCNDGIDNDCDGQWDYDTLDRGPAGNVPSKGDNSCAIGITGISVSQANVEKGNNFEITCTTTVPQINSIDAYIGSQKCNFIENSWSGNNVRFLCSTSIFDFGSQIAKCTIDSSKSYQSGADQITNINIVANICSQYTTSGSCNADPATRCGWCDECFGNKWSGGASRCLDKNSCSYQLTAGKCGAVCDATLGCSGATSCDNLDGCYAGKYRDYQSVNQWCDLNDGQCKNSICSVYVEAAADSEGLQDPLSCKDGIDNDCDGLIDCADLGCAGKTGPNNLVCCQAKNDCPADGAEAFTGCVNDNTRKGVVGNFACELNECKSTNLEATSSCNTNCCFPSGGSAACVNSGKASIIDVDNDARTEVCDAGNWVGANCLGSSCSDDGTAPHPDYSCAANADCQQMVGQCGEEVCLSNVCIKREKTNKIQVCESLMPASYQCAKFFSCSASTNYNCQYVGDSILCADKYPITPGKNPYDTACSMNPDFRCNVDVCISEAVTTNPCCLCYSQCVTAANDPNVAPDSTSECNIAKNYQWTNAQCPFTGGG